MPAVLVDNGNVIRNAPARPRDVLTANPHGVYTTTSVVPKKGIADWPLHRARLHANVQQHDWGTGGAKAADLLHLIDGPLQCPTNVGHNVRTACTACWDAAGSSEELTLFIQLYLDKQEAPHVACHVSPLKMKRPLQPGMAAIVGPPRQMPAVKDCAWAQKRAPYETHVPPQAVEGLLAFSDGRLTEGLVTNLWIVGRTETNSQVVLHTAPDDSVLGGVMRQRVLQACDAAGVVAEFAYPEWNLRRTWTEAFVTNSLRGIQPLNCITLEDTNWLAHAKRQSPDAAECALETDTVHLPFAPGPVTDRLTPALASAATYTPLGGV